MTSRMNQLEITCSSRVSLIRKSLGTHVLHSGHCNCSGKTVNMAMSCCAFSFINRLTKGGGLFSCRILSDLQRSRRSLGTTERRSYGKSSKESPPKSNGRPCGKHFFISYAKFITVTTLFNSHGSSSMYQIYWRKLTITTPEITSLETPFSRLSIFC